MKKDKKVSINDLKRIIRDLVSSVIFFGSLYYTIGSISNLKSSFGYSSVVEILNYLETFFFSITGVSIAIGGFVPEIVSLLEKFDNKKLELDKYRINNRKKLDVSFSDSNSLEETKKQIEFLIKEKQRILSSENEKTDNNIVRVRK